MLCHLIHKVAQSVICSYRRASDAASCSNSDVSVALKLNKKLEFSTVQCSHSIFLRPFSFTAKISLRELLINCKFGWRKNASAKFLKAKFRRSYKKQIKALLRHNNF